MKNIYCLGLAFAGLAILLVSGCKKKDAGPPPTAPVVTTIALTNVNISSGTAIGGGSIVSDGGATITQSGIVWSKTNTTPALTDSLIVGTTATGTFTRNIVGLDFNNIYYFRAFATNSVGTGYGNVVTLTTSSDSIRFAYNGLTVAYGIITSPTTGKKWLDRNLGAKQAATAYNDYLAYGDLFQWGRPADGHQLTSWTATNAGTSINGTTTTIATSDVPGHNNFVLTPDDGSAKGDWRSDNNINRWNTARQGPCPNGWHVPTLTEWNAEISSTQGGTATTGGITNYTTAYSTLKLTTSGYRKLYQSDAGLVAFASTERGNYWASNAFVNGFGVGKGQLANFAGSYAQTISDMMATGYSVRCIKD